MGNGPLRADPSGMSAHNKSDAYENHPREKELQNASEHAFGAAGHHGHSDHLTPHEQTRRAQEHSAEDQIHPAISHFGHGEIALLAYSFWEQRGRPEGSGDEDWYRAVKELRTRALTHLA
jgi:hypothetical protein